MSESPQFSGLRTRLREALRRVIGNREIERKEMAAFDIVMSRREVLQHMGAVTALVAAGMPPTAWGRREPELAVAPSAVGLTAADMAAVTTAAGLSVGTETFQDSIYAQQVVSPEAVGTHAVIEGRRNLLRAQSVLDAVAPLESQFLDIHYHFGPPELLQLEEVGNDWELVHYYHPGAARSDGTKTDGLVRHVVIPAGTLVNPTKVVTITGTYSNRFSTDASSPSQVVPSSQVAYAVFVEDPDSDTFGGWVAVGRISVHFDPPYTASADSSPYPLEWGVVPLHEILGEFVVYPSDIPAYQSCDTYTRNAYQDSAAYDAAQATEHIVLYYADTSDVVRPIQILSLIDIPSAGSILELGDVGLKFSGLPLPTGNVYVNQPWRVINIDWDPTNPDGDPSYRFTNVTVATTFYYADGDPGWAVQTITPSGATTTGGNPFGNLQGVQSWRVQYADDKYLGHQTTLKEVSGSGVDQFDFSTIGNVHTLFSGVGNNPYVQGELTAPYRVVLARFASAGLAMFVLGPSDWNLTLDVTYGVQALFPVALPDSAGVGVITNVAGGASKFGGLRFVVSDEDGNVFLLRQQRAPGTDTPYTPAVYGPFDALGAARTDWNTTGYDSLPPSTSTTSPLHDLKTWASSFDAPSYAPFYVAYNMLLSALAGLGTTSSNQTQGTWLGNGYQAAYALSRFSYDSVHVVVKAANGGASGTYAAYTMFCNPMTRAWHQRLIAQQVIPQAPGMNESGDHFQATVIPVNVYGQPVPLTSAENVAMNVEVRADVPTLVTDDTHNLYYNVDQYSSFMAAPDPVSGKLALVVKAESFAQVLYLRLVETSALTPSGGDAALLSSTAQTTFPWVAVNMAAQAQVRMGNTSDSSSVTGTGGQTPDTNVYVSGTSLMATNDQTPWSFKGDYSATQSNMDDLGSYLNTSGRNMLQVTAQTTGGDPVNPLTTLTPVSSAPLTLGTTAFGYAGGTITHTTSAPAPAAVLGGIWSGVNHALHDALHWLQHVEGNVYKELASDGVTLEIAEDTINNINKITVTVSKDIMKQVNGLENDLVQAVTTVEEYASVVINVLVSIVQETFIYQLIETIIALISLFIYIEDIKSLSHSLRDRFVDILEGNNGQSVPMLPTGFSIGPLAPYAVGPDNYMTDVLGASAIDTSVVPLEFSQGLVNVVSANPFTTKMLDKFSSETSLSIAGGLATAPLSFEMDGTVIQSMVTTLGTLGSSLVEAFAGVTTDVAATLLKQLAADAENPQKTYTHLATSLGPLTEQIADDVLDDVWDFVDSTAAAAPGVALSMIGQDPYLTLKIPGLADLCKLFGLGTVKGSELTLSAKEALFFPLAMMIWITVYNQDGKSINSVGDLGGTSTTAGLLGGSAATWGLISEAVDVFLAFAGGVVWSAGAADPDSEDNGTLNAIGAYINLISWINDTTYTFATSDYADDVDVVNVLFRLWSAFADASFTTGSGNNPGDGWSGLDPSRTDMTEAMNFLMTLIVMVFDTYQVASASPSGSEIEAIVGEDIFDTQIVATFLYDVLQPDSTDLLPYVAPYVVVSPFGLSLTIGAEGGGGTGAVAPSGRFKRPKRLKKRKWLLKKIEKLNKSK